MPVAGRGAAARPEAYSSRPFGRARTVWVMDYEVSGRGPDFWYPPSPMASVCDICGKSPGFGNNISHSHRRTRRRWNPNIQKLRVTVGGAPKRVAVCTKCLKANKVSRAG